MKYRVVLTLDNSFEVNKLHQIEANDLLELMSKFSLLLFKLERDQYDDAVRQLKELHYDDDIPF